MQETSPSLWCFSVLEALNVTCKLATHLRESLMNSRMCKCVVFPLLHVNITQVTSLEW